MLDVTDAGSGLPLLGVWPTVQHQTEGAPLIAKRPGAGRDCSIMKGNNMNSSRRQFLRQAAIASGGLVLAGPVLSACAGGAGNSANSVTFTGYGGAYQDAQAKAWLDPFVKANPDITVVKDSPTEYAKIEAMVRSGNVTWDLVDVSSDYGLGPTTESLTQLDCGALPCAQLQPDLFQTSGFRAPVVTYSNVLAYRTDKFGGRTPTSFADLFNLTDFPGKRSISSSAAYGAALEMALMADGVPADKLYPLDVDRALRKLDTIKSSLTYWQTGQQSAELLANGQSAMGTAWNGRVDTYIKEGAPVQIMWDKHFISADYLVIPKGARHTDAATKLAAYILAPENNARISDYIAYGPTNIASQDKVNPEMKPNLPTGHMQTALPVNDEWWSANNREVEQKFQEWRSL